MLTIVGNRNFIHPPPRVKHTVFCGPRCQTHNKTNKSQNKYQIYVFHCNKLNLQHRYNCKTKQNEIKEQKEKNGKRN